MANAGSSCYVCGALYFYRTGYAPKNWRKPDDLEGARHYERLDCNHILAMHPTKTDDDARRPTPGPRTTSRKNWP